MLSSFQFQFQHSEFHQLTPEMKLPTKTWHSELQANPSGSISFFKTFMDLENFYLNTAIVSY
jgi:hypothetical protein